MSWAEDDWTVGLSGRVLQKVKELQIHQERLSRENKQKQLQLDNIQISYDKQTAKYEEARVELQAAHRELQSVREEVKSAVTSGQRLGQELQTKQAQVCSLEGQLDAARTLGNKLTQEVKRLEAELEKLHRSADTTPFSTPCWSATSPWDHHGSRNEDRTSPREEAESRSLRIRQRLPFSETPSTPLPRQLKTTPRSHPSDQSDSFAAPLAVFPWERDDPGPGAKRPSPSSPQTPCGDIVHHGQSRQEASEGEREIRAQTETSLSRMQHRISSLEEELSGKNEFLKSLQRDTEQSKKKMASSELGLQRAHNELSAARTRISQESERASVAELRLKQIQEELKCQRQNAESGRLQHQQRTKELEKQHQRDLLELQKEKQGMEKQHQQEANKLNQELQQARTLHNGLQAQVDKLSLQKQALDKESASLKEQVKFSERQLQESQKKEIQIQAKLQDAVRDAEGAALSLEQSKKRERALEEESSRLEEQRADALRLLKDLQEQKATPPHADTPTVHVSPVGQPFSPPTPSPTYTKRPVTPRVEQRGGKQEEQSPQIVASYPHDREPGEGIDSEHILTDSERPHREGNHKEKHSNDRFILDSLTSEHSVAADDLQRENAVLRSELRDAREELQKRLEDLEAQRRAETEAGTRLKHLSRKHSGQGMIDRDEQEKPWRTQFEKEKAESERLRKALAALETDVERREDGRAQEERETEMMQLNLQLKEQLGQVKVHLALEREGREQEKAELTRITATKRELNMKVEELAGELAELQRSRHEEEKHSGGLTLRRLDSNVNKLPLPEQHVLFCQAANRHDVTADLIQEERTTTRSDLQKDESDVSDLKQEIERLRKENAQETERAEQSQVKLTALQNQLTGQTQQLTLGFEKQSQYITALLAELREKDHALLSQAEELQRCARALDSLKAEEGKVGEIVDEGQIDDALDSVDSLVSVTADYLADSDQQAEHLVCSANTEGIQASEAVCGQDGGQAPPRLICHLKQQVKAQQKELQRLSQVAKQQAEELAIWRLASQPDSASEKDQTLPDPGDRSALVIREDEVLLSCTSKRLQGRMLSTSVQQNNSAELSPLHAPPAAINKGSGEEPKPSGPRLAQHKAEQQSEFLRTPAVQGGHRHVATDSSRRPDAAWSSWGSTSDSSATSVGTQTEGGHAAAAAVAPERRCAHTQTEDEEDEELDNAPPTAPRVETSEVRETRDKMLFSTSFPIPADPVRLAERIRRNRTQLSAAFDDTEYEPYGLPEVVMKGFADIPTGPSCPYIVRRGLLGTVVVPVTQKEASPEDETD
uniref:centromere protein F n=1 Tax=Doryrhamphus excisus TaxID=161450 RepID=UPI0025ADB682|nr:centromere protein F [Doryrhamphus excisus]